MIKVKGLVKKFESGATELIAVNNIDLVVPEGQFLMITGRSGSGKSTLMYQLGLLDRPTSGDIELCGRDVLKMNEDERTFYRLSKLGYVFQDYANLPALTAYENVVLPLMMLGVPSGSVKKMAEDALIRVGLGDKFNNYPAELSGGQQQRISIARAIAHDPEILFADEPTANLDSETSEIILELFLSLNKDGQTIVMVTHEKEYSVRADRVIELADGSIIKDETLIKKD